MTRNSGRWGRGGTLALLGLLALSATAGGAEEMEKRIQLTVHPVGQVVRRDDHTLIVIDQPHRPALLGLESYSHVWVIWWLNRTDTPAQRAILQVHPRRDPRNPLAGVFATRAPVRPNPIGLTLCRIVGVTEEAVEVDTIDAFDGTPVLDLKPYIPATESRPDATVPHRF